MNLLLVIQPNFGHLPSVLMYSLGLLQTDSEVKGNADVRESEYYRVGDLIDAKSLYDGTWWEAKINKITVNPKVKEISEEDDGMLYHVTHEG